MKIKDIEIPNKIAILIILIIVLTMVLVTLYSVNYFQPVQSNFAFSSDNISFCNSSEGCFRTNCLNVNSEYGILINDSNLKTGKEKKAFLYGIIKTFLIYRYSESNYNNTELFSIELSCVNERKVYHNYSELPEGNDCVDKEEKYCFVKWEK